jgi:protein gp37
MAENSKIEWTDGTWNPLAGCTRASEGCDLCYAAVMARRLEFMAQADIAAGKDPGHKAKYIGVTNKNKAGRIAFNGTVNLDLTALDEPLTWKKPRRVFVNSMSDLFHKDVPDDFIRRVFDVMDATPQHTYQVLTKRPERMAQWTRDYYPSDVAPHIWCGTSVENQERADERIPHLLNVPARVRFLSCEPLLGPVDLWQWLGPAEDDPAHINWIIAGGESGHGARPMHPQWTRSLRDQCQAAGVAFHFKQWGEYISWSDLHYLPGSGPYGSRSYPWTSDPSDTKQDSTCMVRVGKHAAGRLLDGREWNEAPQ